MRWLPTQAAQVVFDPAGLAAAALRFREPTHVVRAAPEGPLGVAFGGQVDAGAADAGAGALPCLGTLPSQYPEWLGDRAFTESHGLRFPYVAGEMANGIATTRLVAAMAEAGMLGFFGAAGLALAAVERALDTLAPLRGPWGVNLIHSPAEPDLENAVADRLIARGVQRICASAFMGLTPAVVRCAVAGLHQRPDGTIARRHHLFAKISRPEVAQAFMRPAPPEMVDALVRAGQLTADEARLSAHVAIADDITVEADSGGHTDNRPLGALFPLIRAQAQAESARHGYARPLRVGAAGGLGTPAAVAGAFALGAAYVVTGSINQAAVESGLSDDGRRLLAQAGPADVIMAPAADMFEMGVKVQVLRRGTMFGVRALRLYDLYREHDSLESMPAPIRTRLEREILGASIDDVWSEVTRFFRERDARELERAAREPKHKMALCFRWYLGLSSRWAIAGDPGRRADYQIWCGPAMGAFNDWARGSHLEAPERRTAVDIALNLMEGAAAIHRAQALRSAGVPMPTAAFDVRPRPIAT